MSVERIYTEFMQVEAAIDRRYVAVLAGIATIVLIVGAKLRPTKTVAVVSPSETANLQRRVQREDLRDMAAFLASRAQEVSRHVVAIDNERSGVSWGAPGQVLAATEASNPAPLVLLPAPGPLPIPPFPSLLPGERWVLAVARRGGGELLWVPALNSGRQPAECRGTAFEELILNTPMSIMPAGTALFDLDGMLAGVVASCDDQLRAVAASSIKPLLDAFRDPGLRFLSVYGFDPAPLTADTAPAFSSQGLLVREVRDDSLAARIGLRAGDLILAERAELASLLSSASAASPASLRIIRLGRPRTLPWELPDQRGTLGIRPDAPAPSGVPVSIEPGTPAYAAGLRTGDRLLQVGNRVVQRPAELPGVLRTLAAQPALVVYQRADSQMATVVSP